MRRFVLGIGAQKAGTTWLHRYLSEAPGFAAGPMKEYHVWDDVYRIDEEGSPLLEGDADGEKESLRRRLVDDPELYFDHFAELLDRPGKFVAADITPAYSALPSQAFERICRGFEAQAMDCRLIFLMRDPVERCWSAARMYRRKGLTVAGLDPALDEEEFVLRYARSGHAKRRGSYELTIAAAESAVPPDKIHFGFYETQFEPAAVQAVSQFVGIATAPGFAEHQFNVSPKARELPDDIRIAVAQVHAETLEFCARRFPETRSFWPSYTLL